MAVKIQLRGDTKARWESKNPVLAMREVVIETDTNRLKIGDGKKTYNSLPYLAGEGGGLSIENLAPYMFKFRDTKPIAIMTDNNNNLTINQYTKINDLAYVDTGSSVAWYKFYSNSMTDVGWANYEPDQTSIYLHNGSRYVISRNGVSLIKISEGATALDTIDGGNADG